MEQIDILINLLESSISDDADTSVKLWNIIKTGYNDNIDNDRAIIKESETWISEYQKTLITKTTITTLKIKFTSAQWYFIEIPHSQNQNILPEFIPRQSLTSVSRYSTPELIEFEAHLLDATTKLEEKEYNEFIDICNNIKLQYSYIYDISRSISHIDFLTNGASISLQRSYVNPQVHSSYSLEILWARHPIVALKERDFINNDMSLTKSDYIHVITWPNMWWKSTYLRQNALLILMAHIGYDIPCEKANISLVDKIFSRVWSGDNLYLWQSTFMVEMQEISYILRHSTDKSFVIIDEIWRGTSTYDWMSLAWAILDYNQEKIWAKTLFATHYHEIIDHAESLKWASNHSVSVWENEKNIVFLRKIIPGGMKKSYWVEVASLAGIPESVLTKARKVMSSLEKDHSPQQLSIAIKNTDYKKYNSQEYKCECQEIINSIKNIDLDRVSPIESLQKLMEIQKEIRDI